LACSTWEKYRTD